MTYDMDRDAKIARLTEENRKLKAAKAKVERDARDAREEAESDRRRWRNASNARARQML